MNITDEMVERAAKAMAGTEGETLEWPDSWDGRDEGNRRWYRAQARTALEAALGDVEPLKDVAAERMRQSQKWGVQRHSWPEWIAILTEEVGEAAQCAVDEHWRPTGDLARLREELVHVAAVACQIIEHIVEVTT